MKTDERLAATGLFSYASWWHRDPMETAGGSAVTELKMQLHPDKTFVGRSAVALIFSAILLLDSGNRRRSQANS